MGMLLLLRPGNNPPSDSTLETTTGCNKGDGGGDEDIDTLMTGSNVNCTVIIQSVHFQVLIISTCHSVATPGLWRKELRA